MTYTVIPDAVGAKEERDNSPLAKQELVTSAPIMNKKIQLQNFQEMG
jgi:hypothetical protein